MEAVRMMLLGILYSQGELYGYRIERILHETAFGAWGLGGDQSLYDELECLVSDGLVQRVDGLPEGASPARALYRITSEGSEALQEALRDAWRHPFRVLSAQDVATLLLEAWPIGETVKVLRERLASLENELQEIERLERERGGTGAVRHTWRAVINHARTLLQGEIEWTRQLIGQAEAGSLMLPEEQRPRADRRGAWRARHRDAEGLGAFTFVLHTHLPYCRKAGRWPHGEEWLHEAMAETYVPLLDALYDLRDEGVPFKLTMSLTPVLTEQLADADVREHFLLYLDAEIQAARQDVPRFGEEGDLHLEYLAGYYRDTYQHIRESFLKRFSGDLVAAFRELQDEGYLEIVTSAATHGYLPLLARDSSIYGQLRAGIESYRRHFHRSPRAIWLPECAYRPAYIDTLGITRPAIEEFLAGLGITCFFVETHAIEGGQPVGKAAGDVAIGPYTAIRRRYALPMAAQPAGEGTSFEAYYVVGSSQGLTSPPVAAIGRNNRTGQQVWSADWGYPGEADYREFHKKDPQSGLQYWRVTGPRVDLGDKDYYHPDWANARVGEHAGHYAQLVEALIRDYHAETGRYGIVSSNYDTELFGHWWFEGVEWIKETLRELSGSDVVDLTTASDYLAAHEPEQVMALPESSWGAGGTHWTWDNPDTHWMWAPIHEAERRMEQLVARYPEAQGERAVALNQAARELLLIESSDWPFLVTTGQAREYAIERFQSHLGRFHLLADLIEADRTAHAADKARECFEQDNVFPTIDYRWFGARQGSASCSEA
jgi:1,4-alpha-glucan branching enzyme